MKNRLIVRIMCEVCMLLTHCQGDDEQQLVQKMFNYPFLLYRNWLIWLFSYFYLIWFERTTNCSRNVGGCASPCLTNQLNADNACIGLAVLAVHSRWEEWFPPQQDYPTSSCTIEWQLGCRTKTCSEWMDGWWGCDCSDWMHVPSTRTAEVN